jgi:hypothetical protein
MNSRNQSEGAVVCMSKGSFTGTKFSSFGLRKTTSLRVSLLDKITFHDTKILSHALSALQGKGPCDNLNQKMMEALPDE